MVKKLIKKAVALTVATVLMFSCNSLISIREVKALAEKPNYGVGKGVVWPEQICAPYLDLCDYYTTPGYQVGGAPYMPKLAEDTGLRFFNLAFIQAAGKTVENGKVKWGWGGYEVLSEPSTDEQYLGMKKSLKDLRAIGGDATISFGGRDGVAIWQVTRDENILASTYREVIEGYGLTRMDLDIEEGAQGKEDNIQNAKAIKKVQDETGIEVTLTVPVLPSGLTETQMDVLEAYLTQGVDIKMVNIMAMCFGSNALEPGENYGTGSVRAIDSTMKQIKEYYKKYTGVLLTDNEAYRKVGVTTSIGFESGSDPIYTPEWSKLVTDHGIKKGIGMTSFWSINRDSTLQPNEGIKGKYEHTKEYIRLGTTEVISNYAPEIYGVNDKKIALGKTFDKLLGVRAVDREDGVITDKVEVSGNVNTSVPGIYTLIYSVKDSGSIVKKVERKITVTTENIINNKPNLIGVEDKTLVKGGYFNPMTGVKAEDVEDGDISYKIEYSGKVDTMKSGKYFLNYKVTDSDGYTTSIDTVVTIINPEDYIEEFDYYKVYNGGELVRYKGIVYRCKGWSTCEYPDGEWTYSWEKVELPGTVLDLAVAAAKYNRLKGQINYDGNYDINSDGIIDIYDLIKIAIKI